MGNGAKGAVYGALLCLLLIAAWFGSKAWTVYNGVTQITGKTIVRSTFEPTLTIPPLDSNQRINFLILGSDNDKKKEEVSPLTQSMIVVTVDPRDHKVGMLSIPRDFYVPIRGHGMQKIDLAHKYGGVQLARETVEKLFGVPIDYYAWVGLSGFQSVIDTLGGVTLDVTHPILDDYYPDDLNSANPYAYKRVFLAAGWQHMNGEKALEYVRSRHGDLIGDFGRSARQQQVLLQLQQHLSALNVFLHLPDLVSELQGRVLTDVRLTQLYQLEQLARHIRPTDITQVVLQAPTYSHYAFTRNGQSIVVPDWPKIRPVVAKMFAPLPPVIVVPPKSQPRSRLRPTVAPATTLPQPTPTTSPAISPTPTPRPSPTPTPSLPARLPGELLIASNGTLQEMTRDRNTRVIASVDSPAMASVAPRGRYIAYVRFTKYESDIWTMDLRTGRQRRLTRDSSPDVHANLWAAWPSFTSDGRSIVFSYDRQKLSQPESETRSSDLALWTMSGNGLGAAELTSPAKGAGGDTDPAPRPGSGEIAYVHWDYI
ncbi:MAG TPA: LCP family protein, partial [Chloroflexota bacterium]